MSSQPQHPYRYPAGTFLGAHPSAPSRPSSPRLPIIPSDTSPGGSPGRLQPVVYKDELGNLYAWRNGSPWEPAGYIPLPPTPSSAPAQYLPPSREASPQQGLFPLPEGRNGPSAYQPQQYPQVNPYPYAYYASPKPRVPTIQIQELLKSNNPDLLFDLTAPDFSPLTPDGRRGVTPIHPGYLARAATYPELQRITIISRDLAPFEEEWAITVESSAFLLSDRIGVTVRDVLQSVHRALQTAVTHAEWAKVSKRDAHDVGKAFRRRCRALGSGFEREKSKGVKRCDFLGDKIVLAGLSQVRGGDGSTFKLNVKTARK